MSPIRDVWGVGFGLVSLHVKGALAGGFFSILEIG